MILSLFKRRRETPSVERLYGDVVAAARAPALYRELGAPDTVMGRFEVLALHVSLILRRLRALPPPADQLAQELVDAFFAELDAALRQIGIGDVSVPKKVKKLGEAFYGRAKAYDDALAEDAAPDALEHAIARNLLDKPDAPTLALALARHVRQTVLMLDKRGIDDILAGRAFADGSLDGNALGLGSQA
ncbi:MAG: ubiquinol-cytochrome C chaperone family protein [Beijerinckiaceae bacterium]